MIASIAQVERLLPGQATAEGPDPRWQAIITLEPLIHSVPEVLWPFIARWGSHPDEDLRTAIATCLLEHLLEYHFTEYFPRVEALTRSNPLFAKTFQVCSKFGQTTQPQNKKRFLKLQNLLFTM
ncbi:hypothetical protein [Armatimonas sp.]|uniref:hypothetical protein n=1 Tax=Armatimonas sp. TaxID=1872638 RepID=UPI00286CF4CA|nr:hypothetical protein [Armatimonas sp.]